VTALYAVLLSRINAAMSEFSRNLIIYYYSMQTEFDPA